jgi:hypothetical protein
VPADNMFAPSCTKVAARAGRAIAAHTSAQSPDKRFIVFLLRFVPAARFEVSAGDDECRTGRTEREKCDKYPQ